MIELILGQNIPLPTNAKKLSLRFCLPNLPANYEMESCAFLLNAQGKTRPGHDWDFVFYNALNSKSGVLKTAKTAHQFNIELDKVPRDIVKVVFTLSIENGAIFSTANNSYAELLNSKTNQLLAKFNLPTASINEASVIFLEIYRYQQNWKLRALGKGFRGTIADLAESFGVEITDAPPPSATGKLKQLAAAIWQWVIGIKPWFDSLSFIKKSLLGLGFLAVFIGIGEVLGHINDKNAIKERQQFAAIKTLEDATYYLDANCKSLFHSCEMERDAKEKEVQLRQQADKEKKTIEERQTFSEITTLADMKQFTTSCQYYCPNDKEITQKRKEIANIIKHKAKSRQSAVK